MVMGQWPCLLMGVTVRWSQLSRLGSFWCNSWLIHILSPILSRTFTKLDMMDRHGSVTMPIDGLHGPVITVQLLRLGTFWLNLLFMNILGSILSRNFTKLYMIGRHVSVIMLMNGVTVWWSQLFRSFDFFFINWFYTHAKHAEGFAPLPTALVLIFDFQ